jgi:hypothetical protein
VLIDQDWRPLSQVDDWWQGDIKLSGAKATVIAQMQGQDDYVGCCVSRLSKARLI